MQRFADDNKMNSELMRQLVALNDKIVNGEELNALQRQLRSELSALLALETVEKNKPKASDASPIAAEGGNDFVNDPVYVAPASYRKPSILGQSTSAKKDTSESLNDPVDCNPSIGVTQSVPSQREQTTAKDLSFNNFNISAPFGAGKSPLHFSMLIITLTTTNDSHV